MLRGSTGTHEVTAGGGEAVRAFVPRALPPVPEVDFREGLRRPLEAATTALGRLDAVTELLPDATLFVYGYVRKEAVLSSQIEGTQSSLADPAGSALRVHQSLVERPVGDIGHLARRTGLSAPTVAAALRLLEELDIVREITGRQRGKVFTYERYLAVLREGTEDPPG